MRQSEDLGSPMTGVSGDAPTATKFQELNNCLSNVTTPTPEVLTKFKVDNCTMALHKTGTEMRVDKSLCMLEKPTSVSTTTAPREMRSREVECRLCRLSGSYSRGVLVT